MAVALCATSLVVLALLWEVSLPFWDRKLEERRARKAAREAAGAGYDPGRERRAEQRARELLKSCVNDEEWGMYRDLGFIRVLGRKPARRGEAEQGAAYAYLIY